MIGWWMRVRPAPLVAGAAALVLAGLGALYAASSSAAPNSSSSAGGGWVKTGSTVSAHLGRSSVRLQDGRILVAGGITGPFRRPIPNAQIFDPATNSWKAVEDMPQRFGEPHSILLKDGRVLLVGGQGVGGPTAAAFLYDPGTDAWSKAGSLAIPRLGGETLTLLADGRVLLAGGLTGAGPAVVPTADVEIYDPAANNWIESDPLPEPLADQAAVLLPSGHAVVIGGSTAIGNRLVSVAKVYKYAPPGNGWSDLSSMPVARSSGFAYAVPDGAILVFGGVTGGSPGGPVPSPTLSSAYYYDVAHDSWSGAPGAQISDATQLSDGRIAILGPPLAGSRDVVPRIFDPATSGWKASTLPPTRLAGATHMVALSDGRALVYEPATADATQTHAAAYLYDPNLPAAATRATPFGLYGALAALGAALAMFVAAVRRTRRAWSVARPLLIAAFQVIGLFLFTYVLIHVAGLQPLPLSQADVSGGAQPGELYLLNQPIGQVLLQTTTLSLILCVLAAGWATAVGLGGAVIVTGWRGRWFQPAAAVAALLWVTPTFLLAVLVQELQAQFYGHSGLVVAAGFGDVNPAQVFWAAVVLGLRPAAYLYRQTRAALDLQLDQDYARTGLAKGLSWRLVVTRHVLSASAAGLIAPWLNAIRLMVGALPLVEFFFGYPGLGRVLILALGISQQASAQPAHETLVIGIVVVMGLILAFVEGLGRFLQLQLDPRLREARAG